MWISGNRRTAVFRADVVVFTGIADTVAIAGHIADAGHTDGAVAVEGPLGAACHNCRHRRGRDNQ